MRFGTRVTMLVDEAIDGTIQVGRDTMERVRKLISWIMFGLVVAAIAQQLRRPASERTWHGNVAFVPYDFRIPTLERIKAAWWNPDDERIITPRAFGVGWAINLYQLRRRALMLVA
jgi:hypothetical protein